MVFSRFRVSYTIEAEQKLSQFQSVCPSVGVACGRVFCAFRGKTSASLEKCSLFYTSVRRFIGHFKLSYAFRKENAAFQTPDLVRLWKLFCSLLTIDG